MFRSASSSAICTAWLIAVFGAAVVLVAPITRWMTLLEIVGMTTCLVATSLLAALYLRR